MATTAKNTGKLKALDGRYIPVRHAHASLNTLLQSAGAIICKQWVIRFHEILKERGYKHGEYFKQAAYIHDEIVIQFDPTKITAEELGQISQQSIQEIGVRLGVRLPLATDWKVGLTYDQIH